MAGLLLNEKDRMLLEDYYLSKSSEVQQKRIRLILLYDDGLLTHQAAQQAGFSRSQARYWKHQFLMDGLSIFPGIQIDQVPENSTGEYDSNSFGDEQKIKTIVVEDMENGELPLPVSVIRPGILPNDTIAEAGRKTWLYQFAEMIRNEEPTRIGEDIEGLHDMRVATRRMRAAFHVFGKAFKSKVIIKHLKGLRATGHALGKVRDMDVLIHKLDDYLSTLDEIQREGIKPLLDTWMEERENSRQELIKYLSSPEYIDFKFAFNRFVQTPDCGIRSNKKSPPQANLVYEVVPVLIYERLGAVRAYNNILQNASNLQLHALRIEFKRLRYTTEYFREVLGEEACLIIQDLKLMQDRLGDFHDAVVACDLVTSYLQDWEKSQITRSLSERQNLEAIVSYLAYLHSERYRLLRTLPEAWQNINRQEFRTNLAKAVAVL